MSGLRPPVTTRRAPADELTDLVDLMRHLRSSEARRHVRLEVPFYTGHRIAPSDLPRVLR